jgi:glycosyltransferase involved in cell wall biosynthesis
MKILHVITDLKIGGESKHLARAISSLGTFEHVVSCLTVTTDPEGSPGNVRPEIEGLGIRVVDLGISRDEPVSAARAFVRLQKLARHEKPNLVHSTLIHANLLSEPLTWSGYPVICSHVVTNPWQRNWRRAVERHTGKRAIFIANSHAVADSLVAGGLDPRRIRVLYYGVDSNHFRPEGERACLVGDQVLLGLGRLHSQKGFGDLIQAAALLPDRPDVVLVGDGPLRERLARRAEELGVRLAIVTAVPDIAPYLRRANVVVLPSLYEGLPNVLLEALATECAVVATDLPGHREVIHDGENGIIVAPSDAPALANAIRRALDDDGSLGAEGRRTMLAGFRWDGYIERRRLLYECVAGATG